MGERKEKIHAYEKNIDQLSLAYPQLGTRPAAQAYALVGNQTSNLFICRPSLNPLRCTSQGHF